MKICHISLCKVIAVTAVQVAGRVPGQAGARGPAGFQPSVEHSPERCQYRTLYIEYSYLWRELCFAPVAVLRGAQRAGLDHQRHRRGLGPSGGQQAGILLSSCISQQII